MRWNKKAKPVRGDERIITKFLLFPKNIDDDVRWLERVSYKQKYTRENYEYGCYHVWETIEWID